MMPRTGRAPHALDFLVTERTTSDIGEMNRAEMDIFDRELEEFETRQRLSPPPPEPYSPAGEEVHEVVRGVEPTPRPWSLLTRHRRSKSASRSLSLSPRNSLSPEVAALQEEGGGEHPTAAEPPGEGGHRKLRRSKSLSLIEHYVERRNRRREHKERKNSERKGPRRVTAWSFSSLDRNALKYGLQVALGAVLASFFFIYKGPLTGTGGIWVAITLTIVVEKNLGSSFTKSFQRIVGTVGGGALGLATASLVARTGPDCFQCSYKVPVLGALIFAESFVLFYYRARLPRYSYLFTLAILTLLLVLDGEMPLGKVPSETKPARIYYIRTAGVSIGIAVAFLVCFFVFPNRASSTIRAKMVGILKEDLTVMFREVFEVFVEETVIGKHVPHHLEAEAHLHVEHKEEEDELLDPALQSNLEHFQLANSAKAIDLELLVIANKISDCRDMLKLCAGEPVFRWGAPRKMWILPWEVRPLKISVIPEQKIKDVLLGIRVLFNLVIPLAYLLSFDSVLPNSGAYDMLLDFYEKELHQASYQIEGSLASISEFLATGDESDRRFALEAIRHLSITAADFDQKRAVIGQGDKRFPVSEIQAFYQIRSCLHFFVVKARLLVHGIQEMHEAIR